MKAKLCFPEKRAKTTSRSTEKTCITGRKRKTEADLGKKEKRSLQDWLCSDLKIFFFKKGKKRSRRRTGGGGQEEEGRPVSDGPKSNQRPGSACSQTQTYAAQGRKQRLIHTCSLNNTRGKKIIIKILHHNIFFYCCSWTQHFILYEQLRNQSRFFTVFRSVGFFVLFLILIKILLNWSAWCSDHTSLSINITNTWS